MECLLFINLVYYYIKPEVAFFRDIPSHEKNPDPGDKKYQGYPEAEKSQKIPNPGNIAKTPGIKIPKLR